MVETQIREIRHEAEMSFREATSEEALETASQKYLGRKSTLSTLLRDLKSLPEEERRRAGKLGNETRKALEELLAERRSALVSSGTPREAEWIDVTAPGTRVPVGHLHPITLVENEIVDIFSTLGFTVADGPEVENDWYNFTALNFPPDHPARDMQDTFWIASEKKWKDRYLMRTHTSAVQVRYLQEHKPPIRIVAPGRVFRNEATDASHEHTFHQFDCLMVEDGVSVATFKYMAETFFTKFFEKKVTVRLRPSFFPFTEPSFEFDISCVLCDAKGCPACKQSGWLEIGGAGMVNQRVFEAAGYKRGSLQGFAWGFGITRLAMMKYHIPDIRMLMSGDLRFIRQF